MAFSAAMHDLIGLDADGKPLAPMVTWADGRAAAQARRLRASGGSLALHRRTGTPVHPMSPLVKLLSFRQERPELWHRVAHATTHRRRRPARRGCGTPIVMGASDGVLADLGVGAVAPGVACSIGTGALLGLTQRQTPHMADEVCVVLQGRGRLRVAMAVRTVRFPRRL